MEEKNYRVVVIDDDKLFLKVIESYLSSISWTELVGAYSNPIDGARAIERHNPDLVLIDFSMPYLDGLEVLETLEKKPTVVMISGDIRNLDIPAIVRKVVNKETVKSANDLEGILREVVG